MKINLPCVRTINARSFFQFARQPLKKLAHEKDPKDARQPRQDDPLVRINPARLRNGHVVGNQEQQPRHDQGGEEQSKEEILAGELHPRIRVTCERVHNQEQDRKERRDNQTVQKPTVHRHRGVVKDACEIFQRWVDGQPV